VTPFRENVSATVQNCPVFSVTWPNGASTKTNFIFNFFIHKQVVAKHKNNATSGEGIVVPSPSRRCAPELAYLSKIVVRDFQNAASKDEILHFAFSE